MSEKHPFASPAWLAALGDALRTLDLSGIERFVHCEELRDAPAELSPAGDGVLAFHYRVVDGVPDVRAGAPDGPCDERISGAYDTVARLASLVYTDPDQLGEAQSLSAAAMADGSLAFEGDPQARPAALVVVHDLIAPFTQ